MIRKLLIANRGEIARRIVATARKLGIGTVAVHSEADARALHRVDADETIAIGPAEACDSDLKVEHVIEAAAQTGADAVHPGYGVLSESADFARACRDAGLCFVGPPTTVIETMGRKTTARRAARAAGVPILDGSDCLEGAERTEQEARRVGYPLWVKPCAGGGGVGIVRVDDPSQLAAACETVRQRAGALFSDDGIYLEKVLEHPRHVEIQIAGDRFGNLVHMGERECSVQRRCQKILEESPSPAVDDALRQRMTEAALRLGRHIGYSCLGTVEMLVRDQEFYFLEMSTRLQVEHTVTEMVTGLDLVEWQLRCALGEELPAQQDEIRHNGHAMECRIYAEDVDSGCAPCHGAIREYEVPTGPWVRNDVAVAEGDFVNPFYDALVGKLVVCGPSREVALQRMLAALADYRVVGVATNVDLHRRIMQDDAFQQGVLSTHFLEERFGFRAQ